MKRLLKSRTLIFMLVVIIISMQCSFVFGQNQTKGGPMKVNVDNNLNGVNVTVLESDSAHTVMRFDVGRFGLDKLNIDDSKYYKIDCEGTTLVEEAGSPELPRVCRSITIPYDSEAEVNVISSEYTDYKKTPIAPSKGSITRDKNPEDIPYTFGEAYESDSMYPDSLVSISEPFILRELRGATVRVNPFQYQPSKETLRVYTSITVEVTTGGQSDINILGSGNSSRITKDFESIYNNVFINYNNNNNNENSFNTAVASEDGEMLIISYDQFSSAMDSFVQWKQSKGITTTLVNRSTVSSSNSASEIKSYIQSYYNQHPNLAYVLLVGDYAQVSSPSYSDGVSDPEYTKVAGSDNYPDIFVGRFSAESVADVQTQVQRTIDFENNGYNTAAWYMKGIGIASAEGSNESDEEHIDNIRSKLLNYGYTTVDQTYDPGASASTVTSSLNSGRGIINYCGHGASTYWVTTGFSNSNVAALQNQGQLPFILSVSCVSGQFQSGTCFAEAWLRSKNASGNPIGAIGAYMSTVNQPWTPPMVGQDAIIDLLCAESKVSYGGLCYTGACSMLDNGTSDDILTFNTWTVFGDPSIQLVNGGGVTPPPTEDNYEPNNTTGTAYGPLTSGTNYNSYIASSTDIDYYYFDTTAAGTIAVTLTNLPKDYDLYLYNSSGTQVGSSLNGSTSNESISYTASSAGKFYAKVIGYNGVNSTSPYTLKATYPTGGGGSYQWYYETTSMDSAHNYTNNYNGTQQYSKTGAQKVSVHFSRFETESGYDFVYIKDKNGNTVASYNGTQSAFWATVDGDTLNINLVSDYSVTAYGYHIDQVGYYSATPLTIAGSDAENSIQPTDELLAPEDLQKIKK